MKYAKPPLTLEQQTDLLLSRGMHGDRATMIDRLRVVTLFRGSHPDVRKAVAARFGVHDVVLSSWLLALNTVRNICAHHGRLWNRELGTKPKIPAKDQTWHTPVAVGNDRIFGILTICRHCLRHIAPQSRWPDRWRELLAAYPYVPRGSMGIPKNWLECPIWAPAAPSTASAAAGEAASPSAASERKEAGDAK
jgi:abortive infection bacteriophage resistance protein